MNSNDSALWTQALAESRLDDDMLTSATLDGVAVVLAKSDGEVFAFIDVCPHRSAPLSDGDIEDGQLICASHGWVFDLRTGASTDPQGHQLQRLPCRLADGWVHVDTTHADTDASS